MTAVAAGAAAGATHLRRLQSVSFRECSFACPPDRRTHPPRQAHPVIVRRHRHRRRHVGEGFEVLVTCRAGTADQVSICEVGRYCNGMDGIFTNRINRSDDRFY